MHNRVARITFVKSERKSGDSQVDLRISMFHGKWRYSCNGQRLMSNGNLNWFYVLILCKIGPITCVFGVNRCGCDTLSSQLWCCFFLIIRVSKEWMGEANG